VVIGGPTGKWFSGSLIQQTGLNCATAILGSAYTEVMVSGIASYGGLPAVPRVNQPYWTSLLVAIPGNPCGTGSASVNTDVVMPPNTTYDATRQIRCFGQSRTGNTFTEITNETWSFLGSSGRYCPTGSTTSALHQGGLSFGFRPLASGQLFQIFVPVKSSQPLVGIANNPADGFRWLTDASGVYANPGLSTVWANVFPAVAGSPAVFFARDPTVVPYWKADAPSAPIDKRNRVELWANVYTAGLEGNLCYEVRRISDSSLRATCSIDPGWNGYVAPGLDTVQILPDPSLTGPNGGYVPFFFDFPDEWNQDMRITWTFTPTGGSPVSKSADFHTLAGPDTDGDGVADATDACPALRGTESNGCLPAVQGDDDHDGAFGANDKCPDVDGKGAADGCPVTTPTPATPGTQVTPTPTPTLVALRGAIKTKKNARLKRSLILGAGAPIAITCTKDSRAAVSLNITAKTAKTLRIKTKSKRLKIASASGTCKAAGGGKLKLVAVKRYKGNLRAAKKAFAATLALKVTDATGSAAAPQVPVSVG